MKRLYDNDQERIDELETQLRASEAALAQSRENEATEARRVDELLQERNRARNETIAALEKLATSKAKCKQLRREVETRREHERAALEQMAKARQRAMDAQGRLDTDRMIGKFAADEFVAGSLVKRLYDRGKELDKQVKALTREVEDVRKLDDASEVAGDMGHVTDRAHNDPRGAYQCRFSYKGAVVARAATYGDSCPAARRAAVEYLKKEGKDG